MSKKEIDAINKNKKEDMRIHKGTEDGNSGVHFRHNTGR